MTSKTPQEQSPDATPEEKSPAEERFSRIARIIEIYIFLCFLLIIIIPVMEGDWVQPVVRFLYFTGFPLLLLLIIASMSKDGILNLIDRFQSRSSSPKGS
ncbi:MAG TPA: hypothetical protein PKV71_18070 [Calditrichia bacterium]|nr:hypothetical protein [Calditrichota bacterium]HQU73846.1 hypothetical protein [Calditrichia bacterium]HQV33798.1 hypothetical protein [Calditrichia bacterium]